MAQLELWPSYSDDSGTKTDGTVLSSALFDSLKEAIEDLVHSSTNPDESPALTTDEVVAARGNAASLDARISGIIDDDGNFVVGGVVKRLVTSTTGWANSGAGETDMASTSIPAATLASNGQALRVRAWGSFAANGNNKTVKVYFGATSISLHPAAGSNGTQWVLEAEVIRTGAATQILRGSFMHGTALIAIATPVTPAEDLSGAVTLKLTGQGTGSNDVLQAGLVVEALY